MNESGIGEVAEAMKDHIPVNQDDSSLYCKFPSISGLSLGNQAD